MSNLEPFEFESSVSRHLDGALEKDELQNLSVWIRLNPSNARKFARRALLHNQLRATLQCDAALKESPDITITVAPWKRASLVRFAMGLAAIIALVVGSFVAFAPRQESATVRGPAMLTAQSDARWSDPNIETALRSGDLPIGLLHLEQGRAEFMFERGATVQIEGPAEFEPQSATRMFIREGKLLCRCPTEASRMTIVTPSTEITDLGTEFAVTARKDKVTRVSVIEGVVKVALDKDSLRLSVGEAVEVGENQKPVSIALNKDEYAAMTRTAPRQSENGQGGNLLTDPGFDTDIASGTQDIKRGSQGSTWKGTQGFTSRVQQMGRGKTSAAKIEAKGNKYWPWIGQSVDTGDISGQQVVISVWALHPSSDALEGGQNAILKLTFLDKSGRDISNAERHFLSSVDPKNTFVRGDLAAAAPAGTVRVIFSVMLNAQGLNRGSVYFDDAYLAVQKTP